VSQVRRLGENRSIVATPNRPETTAARRMENIQTLAVAVQPERWQSA
jgi:hypothetical protein